MILYNTAKRLAVNLLLSTLLLTSCKKYLDEKPVKSATIPSTLGDLQALLDRYNIINQNGPQMLEALADNYYVTLATYNSRSAEDKMHYIWDRNAMSYGNWFQPYTKPMYYANIVLDQLKDIKITQSEEETANAIKGSALFIRAFTHFEMAQLYCAPYATASANNLGIVLRLTSDINEPVTRSTLQQTYDQIINDLKEAGMLLPETSIYPSRPNRLAVWGTLARVYLSMREYSKAMEMVNQFLVKRNTLLNYNTLNPNGNPVFPRFNTEVVYYNRPFQSNLISNSLGAKIDSTLFKSYNTNDLRRTLFFKANTGTNAGTYGFQGSYDGSGGIANAFVFDGICTDEIYLIKAETEARAGNKDAALQALNTLLVTRWKTGTFISFTAATPAEALTTILTERRKELVYRGLRWTDIRRLNQEGAAIELKRVVGTNTYTLPPNDLRYVLLVPNEVMSLSNIQQTPR